MTPKEKAYQLQKQFYDAIPNSKEQWYESKYCALIKEIEGSSSHYTHFLNHISKLQDNKILT